MLQVALIYPEIPPNTGNIARTCAATNTHLHLVEPLGFEINDRQLKRAGIDYWEYVNVTVHPNITSVLVRVEILIFANLSIKRVTGYCSVVNRVAYPQK
jgi:tRNA (cytidine(34)-2'-O)-methyltransferase